MSSTAPELVIRADLRAGDEEVVRRIVASTGMFHLPEEDIAVELVAERRAKGDASGYHFLFLDRGGITKPAGIGTFAGGEAHSDSPMRISASNDCHRVS